MRAAARFWRVNFALFLGSFATFAMLYCVQPLMPSFARAFSISPAAASLSLSAATGVLAVAMLFSGTLSDALGRKTIMTASLAAAGAATLAASFAPNWTTFVALRALTGLALSGVPAVAMAYLVEEMDRSAIGLAMGLYIAGNTLGGMGGRLASAGYRGYRRLARRRRRCRPRLAWLRFRVRLRAAEGAAGSGEGPSDRAPADDRACISATRASAICSQWASS